MLLITERIEELVNFFKPYFASEDEARRFIEGFEGIPEQKRNAWKVLSQTERLVTLGEAIYDIRKRDALRLLFLIICVEAVAKLCKNYDGEGDSHKYVKLFFSEFCEPTDIERLNGSLVVVAGDNRESLPSEEVIDYLYNVRCSVVHEGRYWDFTFMNPKHFYTIVLDSKSKEVVSPKISYEELRDMIVRAVIRAVKRYIS